MPLDVKPLSSTRRALMLVVLLLLFLASLGLAQVLVRLYGKTLPTANTLEVQEEGGLPAIAAPQMPGFTPADGDYQMLQSARVALRGEVAGAARFFFVLTLPQSQPPRDLRQLAVVDQAFFRQYIGASPSQAIPTALSGHQAIELRGTLERGRGFARMSSTVVGDYLVLVLYLGASPATAEDERNWTRFTGPEFQVRLSRPML